MSGEYTPCEEYGHRHEIGTEQFATCVDCGEERVMDEEKDELLRRLHEILDRHDVFLARDVQEKEYYRGYPVIRTVQLIEEEENAILLELLKGKGNDGEGQGG